MRITSLGQQVTIKHWVTCIFVIFCCDCFRSHRSVSIQNSSITWRPTWIPAWYQSVCWLVDVSSCTMEPSSKLYWDAVQVIRFKVSLLLGSTFCGVSTAEKSRLESQSFKAPRVENLMQNAVFLEFLKFPFKLYPIEYIPISKYSTCSCVCVGGRVVCVCGSGKGLFVGGVSGGCRGVF